MPTLNFFLEKYFEVVPGRKPDPITLTCLLVRVRDLIL